MQLSPQAKPTRVWFCIILLLVLTVHLLYPVSYSLRIYLNKLEQEEMIHSGDEDLTTITLKKEQLARYIRDEGRELSIRGKMYDIAHIEYKGEDVIITALADENETEYNNELADNINKKKDSKEAKLLITWAPVAYYSTATTVLYVSFQLQPMYLIQNALYLSGGYLHRIIKPPQLA